MGLIHLLDHSSKGHKQLTLTIPRTQVFTFGNTYPLPRVCFFNKFSLFFKKKKSVHLWKLKLHCRTKQYIYIYIYTNEVKYPLQVSKHTDTGTKRIFQYRKTSIHKRPHSRTPRLLKVFKKSQTKVKSIKWRCVT